jgi:membrane-associated phospholipid phosphatase
LTSTDYADAFNEVKSLGSASSTTRTADQTQIALFWKDAAGTAYAFGHWNKIAEGVSAAQGLSLVDDARLFALLNIATADALIASWDAKYTYNFWRPVTAIRFPGDNSLNPATVSDPTWTPLIVTPNFPSYMSAHSTVSSAAATVLTSLFGPDYAFTTGSDGLPGVTRSYSSFDAAAAEAGQSRIYGGIHFQFDNRAGLATGSALGQFVFQNFLTPVSGGDTQGDPPHGDNQGGTPAVSAEALTFTAVGQSNVSAPSENGPGGQQGQWAALRTSGPAAKRSALAVTGRPHLLPLQGAHALAASTIGDDQPVDLFSRRLGRWSGRRTGVPGNR